MESGLLISGTIHPVDGLMIMPPAGRGGPKWNRIGVDDYATRKLPISVIVVHSTGGRWPQPVIAGSRPGGHARRVLEMWSGDDGGGGQSVHSGAQIVVDFDGTIFCACDLAMVAAYHAQLVNHRAVGIEMCTMPDGSITEATLHATELLIAALTHSGDRWGGLLAIPSQIPRWPYRGQPLRRLEVDGVQSDGRGLVGVIGHRDQTARRGRGDPGDAIGERMAARGFELVDFDAYEDLNLARIRQRRLNELDARSGSAMPPLALDGVCGAASLAAMRRHGFSRWRDVA